MKKLGRIAWRAALGLIIVLIVLAVVCLDAVDYTPYFRTEYYQQTTERLKARAGATNLVVVGLLEAGFGQAKLTPSIKNIPLAGYGNRGGKPAIGVHDDVYVKAVALRVAGRIGVMFGCDALIVPREVSDSASERLKTELELNREQLYFSATHTHCSLGGWGEGMVGEAFAGKFDPAARAWFSDCIVQAARAAVTDLKPAEFGRGSFEAPEFVRNRLVGEVGKVDPEFSFLMLKQSVGRTGILGSFSAHATTLSADVMEFSGDYPGYWQRTVEELFGGTAVFLAGGVGSHAPVSGGKGFEGAERMGEALAARLIAEIPKVQTTNAIAFGILGLDVSMPPLSVRVTDGLRLRPWLGRKLLPVMKDSYLQGFRMGDAIWISTPCDYSGELALGLKEHFAVRGYDAVVTSFNGDYIGYVVLLRYYHLSTYESRIMSFFGPYVPEYFDGLIRNIGETLIK